MLLYVRLTFTLYRPSYMCVPSLSMPRWNEQVAIMSSDGIVTLHLPVQRAVKEVPAVKGVIMLEMLIWPVRPNSETLTGRDVNAHDRRAIFVSVTRQLITLYRAPWQSTLVR